MKNAIKGLTHAEQTTRVFVTGGAGFIGAWVVRGLLDRGVEVRCLLRETTRTHRIEDLTIERFMGDLTDRDSVLEGMRGCQSVVHLASPSSWDDIHSPVIRQVVVEGTQHVLDAAEELGGLPTVFVSSAIAIGGTRTPIVQDETAEFLLTNAALSYAHAKHEAERRCQAAQKAGLPVVIVNPAEVYGPGDDALVTAGTLIDFTASGPAMVPTGGTSIVYVEDVADGIIAALESGRSGERYILGGDNVAFKDLARTTLDILGLSKKVILIPNPLILALAWLARNLRLPLPFNASAVPYAVLFWWMDNRKAREELGVSFRSAREVLAPTLEWLEAEGLLK